MPGRASESLSRVRRGALCTCIAALLIASFLLTRPRPSYGDDLFFVWILVTERAFTNHVLYVPIGRLLARAGWRSSFPSIPGPA